MPSLTLSLWDQVCQERIRLFTHGDRAIGRCFTEVAALSLIILSIAETVIQGIGALFGLWVCCIPSDDAWKRECFIWIEKRAIALEGALVTTCCCFVQLFTNPWEDAGDKTLQSAKIKLQACLELGFSASP